MINFSYTRTINQTLVSGILAINSLGANAALNSYNSNGVDLVYSSVSDVTWTKDGNLLGSLFASKGFNTVVNAIITTSPTITNTPNPFSLSGTYTLTTNDFSSNGQVSWFGAMAYVNYLNSISYGGVNNWVLPTIANESFFYNSLGNGTAKGDEFAELFDRELNGSAFTQLLFGRDYVPPFDNWQFYAYWSGTEIATATVSAWYFDNSNGFQFSYLKPSLRYAWAISPGMLAAVPEPKSAAMLFVGLGLLSFVSLSRKRNRE